MYDKVNQRLSLEKSVMKENLTYFDLETEILLKYYTPKAQLNYIFYRVLIIETSIVLIFHVIVRAGHVPTFLKSFRSVLERGASA